MLTKCSKIIHPSGEIIETPLFIPSFSSKGFTINDNGKSEIIYPMMVATEFLTECMLISAYDIHNGYLPEIEKFVCTPITFIDSGGYETSSSYDFPETRKDNRIIKAWELNDYEQIIKCWPKRFPAVIVSYDRSSSRIPLKDQIIDAKKLFENKGHFLNDFLIKPETNVQNYIQIDNIIQNIRLLNGFNIIGLTEKELGNSILNRMENIYKIRQALDCNGVVAPIHVFGSLDPITSILYFISGAEIFDGLTWLKYSYYNGMAVYLNNVVVSKIDIHTVDKQTRIKSLTENIYYLSNMKLVLQSLHQNKNFHCLDRLAIGLSNTIEQCYEKFRTNLKNHKLI